MTTILFIDSNIPDYDTFVSGVKVPIEDFSLNTFNSTVNRIGFVWKNNKRQIPFGSIPYEYEQTSEMLPDHQVPVKNTTHYFTKEFVDYLAQFTDPITVDLITCSLDSPVFTSDLEQIKTKLPNVTFNYSVNLTGNAPQGDWIMESSGQDIKSIYFTDDINNWSRVLALPVADTLGSNFTYSNAVTGVLRYTLNTTFVISASAATLWTRIDISHSDATTKVIVDGAGFKITVTANNFDGMFIAGNANNNTYATELINFNFESTATSISTLLARTNDYLLIDNCKAIVTSNINMPGGVFAYYYNNNVKKITLTNSYVVLNGNIGQYGGSLIGVFPEGGSAEIDCCYSIVNGNIDSTAGGFVGAGLGVLNTLQISNCFCIFRGNILLPNSVILLPNAAIFCGYATAAYGGNLILNNNLIIANIINNDSVGYFALSESPFIGSVTGSKNYILDLQGSRANQVSPDSNINSIWLKYTNHASFITQVNANLRQSTDKFTSINYKIKYLGTEYLFPSLELLDLNYIIINNTAPTFQSIRVPYAPTNITGTPGNSQVSLSWTAPTNTGGSAITDYTIQYSVNGTNSWTNFTDGTSTGTTAIVNNLTNGTSYIFQVAAVNLISFSSYSSSSSAVTLAATTPNAPTNITGTPGNSQVSLSWSAPTNTGGSAITDYIIQYSVNGTNSWTNFTDGTSTGTTAIVNNLTNGTSYIFQVAAVNLIGTSSYSSSSSAVTLASTPTPTPEQTIRTLSEFQSGLTLIRSLAVVNPSTSIGSVNILSDMLLQAVIAQVYYNNTNAISSLSLNANTVFKSAPSSATVFAEINSSINTSATTNITSKITERGGTIKIITKIMNTDNTGTFEYTNSNPRELILLAHINETTGEIDEIKSGQIVNGVTVFTVDRFSIWVIYSIPFTASIKSGGDPLISPMFGQTFALASHIKFVNLLSDFTNGIFINGQVGMLEPGDFPQFIYWDSSFTKTSDISHVYSNSYYRQFYIRYHNEELIIDADTLLTKAISKLNKIRLVKSKAKLGLESISFNKTYPLLESTKQIKIGFGPYLLTLTTDLNTDDRHHIDLLITKPQNVINCSGAFISKDQIIRISDIKGKELYQYDSNPFTSIKFTN